MSREYVLQPFRAPVDLHIDYAKELNAQQLAAVTAPPGPALVLAGAGAGKTRTLIYRVAFLLEQGIPADRILLLTFTNKAAREMMRRVTDLLGNELADLWGGTFHSIGHRVLRRHAEEAGFKKNFTILDREDARDLLKACIGESEADTKQTRFPKPDVLQEVFSFAVNTRQSVPEIVAQQYPHFAVLAPEIARLETKFQERKRAANVLDFDDLLVLWLELMEKNEALRERYQRKFQFVLVDEYQDTNRIQGELIDLLAARHQNVMVVGDDSQSIYSWRGANFQNILEFPKRYTKAQIYKIETNYRSTPEILTLANAVIKANVKQFAKELLPARKSGSKPVMVACQDSQQQAAFVAQRMLELREEGVELNQMAVLYRSHFHALELQLELTRRNIPFSITSGIRFFEQAHLKDVAAYMKLVVNAADEMAFKRLAQLLPGIGAKGADKLWSAFAAQLAKIDPAETAPLARALQGIAASAPKKAARAWTEFTITISQLEDAEVRNDPDRMIRVILEAGYEDYLQETYTNYRSRLEDLEQLANFASQFENTEEFLTQLSLLSNVEAEEDKAASRDDEQVRLSTIHQAKGLEFGVVFVIMLCDGLFPSARSIETVEGEEEERRLFYVSVTRAKNELYLSFPILRFNTGGDSMQQPSRFLSEIPKELLEEWNLRPFNPYG
jgi:DNA helicase II / ATP-dependent DNA helicase PcrA